MEITGSGIETVGFVGKEKRNGVWKGHLGPTDTRPPGLNLAGSEAREAFEQGSDVPRARCQEGRCGSSLNGVVALKPTYFKALKRG